jgi:hypothetical protein
VIPGVNLVLNAWSFALMLLDSLLTAVYGPAVEQPSTMYADVEDIPL